ncbi:hypothetical protein AAG570_002906 [Ranatra chinensis]|uniref:Uncharacterized protein n=1 Tax=Ranatra chinensis TaxID=642074 RepID=A0ABD0Y576_9HEMI
MASKRRNMFHKNKTQETTEEAPVARMIKFWSTPLLTTGALTFDFETDKRTNESEYFLLVRTGHLSFKHMARFTIAILKSDTGSSELTHGMHQEPESIECCITKVHLSRA